MVTGAVVVDVVVDVVIAVVVVVVDVVIAVVVVVVGVAVVDVVVGFAVVAVVAITVVAADVVRGATTRGSDVRVVEEGTASVAEDAHAPSTTAKIATSARHEVAGRRAGATMVSPTTSVDLVRGPVMSRTVPMAI